MPRARTVLSAAAIAGTALAIVHGQAPGKPAPPQAGPSREGARTLTVRGCLSRSDDGKGFVLMNAAQAGPSGVGSGTTAASGTSATSAAPSGSITGENPTGSTSTDTTATTPAVGTPPAASSPASPTYNRSQPTGTGGTVAGSDSSAGASVRVYVIRTSSGLDLQDHVGQTVEVMGRLLGDASGPAKAPPAVREAPPTEVKPPLPDEMQPPPTLDVHAIQLIASTCEAR
jgi:hypothetical protein